MQSWQLQDAKQQFSRLVERARADGPQVVTRNGQEVVVVLGVEDYRRLSSDGDAFKRFLIDGRDFDVLEIERPSDAARSVEL